jgi:hypothetical protein
MFISAGSFAQIADKGGASIRFSMNTSSDDKPATVTISGKVLDKTTQQPIAAAKVRSHILVWRLGGPDSDLFSKCPKQETATNAAGDYRFQYVTPLNMSGPFKGRDLVCVYASAPEHETRPVYGGKRVTPTQRDFQIDILLDRGKLIQGTIVDDTGKAVAGANINIQSGFNGDWTYFHSLGETTSDRNGKFQIQCSTDERELVGKNPWLQISKPEFGTGFCFEILQKGDMGNVVLPKGGEIRGKVVDASGKGVANAEVLVIWWQQFLRARTDSQGDYAIVGVARESTIRDFMQKKNGSYKPIWAMMNVYARTDPKQSLSDAATCQVSAPADQAVTAPDLVIGNNATVAGTLIPSKTTPALKGLMVRLDYDWGKMVEADADGRFGFASVPPGKHTLTAYLPTNLRGDRGIGRTKIAVQPQQKLEGVEIKLDELTEVRVQILDEGGNPLEGMTAGATWSRDGSGFWTEGTVSGPDGWSVLYLNPGSKQYIRGFDMSSRKLVAGGFVEADPKPGEVINNVRVTMVKPAAIAGRLTSEGNAPLAGKKLLCAVNYADGSVRKEDLKIDGQGRFEMKNLTPGAVKLAFSSSPTEFSGSMDTVTEIKPGEAKDFGEIALKLVRFHLVKGRLSASPTFQNLESFKIRLDLEEWQPMVPTDAQGNFALDKVPAGKHLLIAYLPYNARTDRGVGHVKIEVKDGDLQDIVLPLETLATIHMRIQNEKGELLEGVSAAAWWTADHSGVFTEGSRSGKDGRATLYLYPDSEQYIGAHDWEGRYTLTADARMTLKPGEEVKDYVVVMR